MKRPPAATDPAALALRERLVAVPWRLLRSPAASGAKNMALDVALLDAAGRQEAPPTLRFYTWEPPAVSLGRFQREDGIDLEYARRRGWDVVRRPTGGRAVLHQHELTYTVVLPPSVVGGAGVRTSYAVLIAALNDGLASLLGQRELFPAPACTAASSREANCFALAGECDTLVREGKLVGSAQVRKDGALLQHGSILLDAEPGAWAALFGTAGRLITLRQLLGETPAVDAVVGAVVSGFARLGVNADPAAS